VITVQKWASNEQKGMSSASELVANEMAKGNADYEAKMGFRFNILSNLYVFFPEKR
jgi:hypothetical protein